MLKEVFVTLDGVALFHYGHRTVSVKEEGMNLTSGLLTALRLFTREARHSELESFTLQNEYFLFTPLLDGSYLLISVFDASVNRAVANNIHDQIKDIVLTSHIIHEEGRNYYDLKKNEEVARRIEAAVETIGTGKFRGGVPRAVFSENPWITFLRVYQLSAYTLIYEDARPTSLLNSVAMKELKDMVGALSQLGRALGTRPFELSIIETRELMLIIVQKGGTLTVAAADNTVDPTLFKEKIVQVCGIQGHEELMRSYQGLEPRYSLTTNAAGVVKEIGEVPFVGFDFHIDVVLNRTQDFVDALFGKRISLVKAYFPSESPATVVIHRNAGGCRIDYHAR